MTFERFKDVRIPPHLLDRLQATSEDRLKVDEIGQWVVYDPSTNLVKRVLSYSEIVAVRSKK